MVDTITSTLNPKDPQYQLKRRKQVDEFLKMTPQQIERNFLYMASQPQSKEQREEQGILTKRVIGDILSVPGLGDQLERKSILDSTGGGTSGGSVLIRQDLEAPVYAYVKLRP